MLYILILSGFCLPWTQQHLLYPVEYCRLSSACVHDGVPVCATAPTCCEHRTFLDQCDMYEYNCDYGTRYQRTYNLFCIPTLTPSISIATERTSTAEISTTPCCDRPIFWDTTTTENVEATSPQDKVTSSLTTKKLTTTTTTPFSHETTTTVEITTTPCCERPISWETTTMTIPNIQEQTSESFRPTRSSTTQKLLTTLMTITVKITAPTTTPRTTTSRSTTTFKTTSSKEQTSHNTDPDSLTGCCDRPKIWETTAYTQVVLTDDLETTTTTTPSKKIATTNKPTSTIQTVYLVSSTESLSSTQSVSESSKTLLETTAVAKTKTTTSSPFSSVCCDRPKVWETTNYSEKVLTDEIELTTTTPLMVTTQITTTTEATTTTTTEKTKTTPKYSYVPSTNTVSESYKSFKPTFVETTLEATTACCERPKVWETTKATNPYESYETTDTSITSLKQNSTTSKTTAQTFKKSDETVTIEDLTSTKSSKTSKKTFTTDDVTTAQTSKTSEKTFTPKDVTATQTSKTSEKTFAIEDVTTAQTSKTSNKTITIEDLTSKMQELTSKAEKISTSIKHLSFRPHGSTNKQTFTTKYDILTSTTNPNPRTKTVSANGDTSHTQHTKITSTKSSKALGKTEPGKSVPVTYTKNMPIHTTSTWWYPKYCRSGKCQYPQLWYTTNDRRSKFRERHNDNKIPQRR